MSDLQSIKNIGPKLESMLLSVGITSSAELYQLGASECQFKLLNAGIGNHIIYFQSIWLGLQGRIWNDATPEEKQYLKTEFRSIQERVKTSFKAKNPNDLPPQLAKSLRDFGVI